MYRQKYFFYRFTIYLTEIIKIKFHNNLTPLRACYEL